MRTAMFSLVLTAFGLASLTSADPPFKGPYRVKHASFKVPTMDATDPQIVVTYPDVDSSTGQRFPLMSYAHGAAGGGWYTFEGYYSLFQGMASHGFVVAATKSCSLGCQDGGWKTYYLEQLKTIEWAKNVSTSADPGPLGLINWTAGVGIAGHSMGGQATVRSARRDWTEKYDIRAAVLHHPETDDGGVNISVPVAAFTGEKDHTCPPSQTHHIWDPAPRPKTLANRVDATHLEPVLLSCAGLGVYTAAWFKIYLEGDQGTYYDLIYSNTSSDALCQYYKQAECMNLV